MGVPSRTSASTPALDQTYLDFRSSSGRCAPSRHQAEGHPQVLIIAPAAVQLSPVLYSREKTVEKIVGKIAELRSRKVQFATFPEAIVPYYPYFTFLQPPFKLAAEHRRLMDQAVTIPSPATDALGEAARQAGIVV